MTSPRRSIAWWSLAEKAASSLTMPRCDVARSDAVVERLLTGSRLFAIARSVAATIGRAWIDSRTSGWLHPIVRDLSRPSSADRVRLIGVIVFVGSVTAIVLRAAGPPRTRWLDSIIPGGMAVAGVLVAAAARAIARALADSR